MYRATTRAAALALCVLPLLSACVSGSLVPPGHSAGHSAGPAQSSAASPPATALASPASTAAQAAPTSAQLTAALPALPAGAKPWVASTGPNGLLDAAGYVGVAFGKANAATDLPIELNRGLQSGARWTWATTDGELVEILLARFRTDIGAQSYYLMEHAAKLKKYPTVTPEPVPGIGTGFVQSIASLDAYGNALVRLHAVAGDTVIVVNVSNPATPDPTTADTLALAIAKKLCADQGCSLG
ncbi:hypothetical protein ABH931_002103 [Streptacidiphilus sp. MAP12-33]|uniref:hypothetical protein n=1 Tax=Streptacidiphilus sp. MAP12-33 TaxID=3156266 RepID=UPI0035185579